MQQTQNQGIEECYQQLLLHRLILRQGFACLPMVL